MREQSLRVESVATPVRSQVVEKLRRAIVEQRFASGERLREKELCELTGVSRTSVREALCHLQAENLVELIPHRGPIVARITPAQAREVYEVRTALEGLAARLFATRATGERVAALAAVVDEMAQDVAAGRTAHLVSLKDRFYDALFAGAGNSEVERMVGTLRARVTVLRGRTLASPGRAEETLKEIRAIVAAIADRDPDRAEAACRAHVVAAARLALDLLTAEEAAS
ncbi:GntR family transcriptional regulator [Phytohabitans suffuscus]|uniref:GntR family transcriptional regulator n=1 Tax=Phytohabitans suffuscus TaxID=624315 RepID=A0A6F8YVI9_9ACTN|nr:GntR family transcriptional regulator [Phytohabitans suffuscus]BCB90013.1 GntR family transcriptional regulator [Phytohabitans suffuscus]